MSVSIAAGCGPVLFLRIAAQTGCDICLTADAWSFALKTPPTIQDHRWVRLSRPALPATFERQPGFRLARWRHWV
jgi:hypothetical protein